MGKYRYKLKEEPFSPGDTSISKGIKSTVKDINPTTGAISWEIDYIPNMTKLVEDVDELTKTAKGVYQKAKDDKKFLDIYEQARSLRNTIRTHIRNHYPEEYKKAMNEGASINEASPIVVIYKGRRLVVEPEEFKRLKLGKDIVGMSSKHPGQEEWILAKGDWSIEEELTENSIEKDIEHLSTLSPDDRFWYVKDFPMEKLIDMADHLQLDYEDHDDVQDRILSNFEYLYDEIEETSTSNGAGGYLTKYAFKPSKNSKKIKEDIGATLGPGPKAGPKGVVDNYYVSKFGYKIVDRKKQAKASKTIDYKDLWGKTYN